MKAFGISSLFLFNYIVAQTNSTNSTSAAWYKIELTYLFPNCSSMQNGMLETLPNSVAFTSYDASLEETPTCVPLQCERLASKSIVSRRCVKKVPDFITLFKSIYTKGWEGRIDCKLNSNGVLAMSGIAFNADNLCRVGIVRSLSKNGTFTKQFFADYDCSSGSEKKKVLSDSALYTKNLDVCLDEGDNLVNSVVTVPKQSPKSASLRNAAGSKWVFTVGAMIFLMVN